MDIQVLAAWGELIGGISGLVAAFAVVGSLLFVGLQIKHSTDVARATARQAVSDSVVTYGMRGICDDVLADAMRKNLDGEPIDDTERFQVNRLSMVQWRTMENIFYQYRQGLLEPDEWASHRSVIFKMLRDGGPTGDAPRRIWELLKTDFAIHFTTEVEAIRQDIEQSP